MLNSLKAALESTGLPFAHFAWSREAAEAARDHGVWAEDSEKALYANNRHAERLYQGMIHWFTRSDGGEDAAKIEAALDDADIPWTLDGVLFEEDTGFLHYVWIFEAVS